VLVIVLGLLPLGEGPLSMRVLFWIVLPFGEVAVLVLLRMGMVGGLALRE